MMAKKTATEGGGPTNSGEHSLESQELILLRKQVADLESELQLLRETNLEVKGVLPVREALLHEAEKVVHLGSWFMNPSTHEVEWSEELFRILGYDPEKDTASAEKFFAAVHPDDLAGSYRNMAALADTGRMSPNELRVVWKDGTVREIRCDGIVIPDEQGKMYRVVGTVLDITDRKKLEEQLRQSQKMEVVGRVAGGVAHDFNNLLTVISGNADLLLERYPDERLQRILDAAEVGAALTRQLLSFSRQTVVQLGPMDLNSAVKDTARIAERLIGEDVSITLELAPMPAIILADRGQAQQILLNLAVNARDAMPHGGEIVFSIHEIWGSPLTAGADPTRWVELKVKDTGKGMDAATRQRAMEPFFTTKEPGKGTGLGLSTIADIIAQLKGSIALVSEPNQGTTVTIRFPHCSQPLGKPQAHLAKPKTGGESILLVEDNPELRQLVALFLTSGGYKVEAVGRPGEAEAIWKTNMVSIDLLITDMVMPEKSGKELAKTLLMQKPSLKALFISGYSPSRSGVGDWSYLQKPFSRIELLEAVRALCDKAPVAKGVS